MDTETGGPGCLETRCFGDLWFTVRPGTSDAAVVEDNVVKRSYEKFFPLERGEAWVDLGGYIGSFAATVFAAGGRAYSFEPDPENAALYEENLRLNGFEPECRRAAVVQSPAGPTGTFYRNEHLGDRSGSSLIHRWKRPRKRLTVPCLSFDEAMREAKERLRAKEICLKIDIEGAEMDILDAFARRDVRKIVFEWHFAFDPSLVRVRAALARLEGLGFEIKPEFKLPAGDTWKNFRRWVMNFYGIRRG